LFIAPRRTNTAHLHRLWRAISEYACLRPDLLVSSFCLRRPSDYTMAEGARFEGPYREGAQHPRRARLAVRGPVRDPRRHGGLEHEGRGEDADRLPVSGLLATGMTVREIAEEMASADRWCTA
jgi:hypothetical protein